MSIRYNIASILFCIVCIMPLYAQTNSDSTHTSYVGDLGHNDPHYRAVLTQLQSAQKHYDELRDEVGALTHEICGETGRIEVSADLLHQAAAKLDEKWLELKLEDNAGKARTDAVLKELEKLSKATTRSVEQDMATIELEKVVAVRQKAYDIMVQTHAAGAVTESEVQAAAADLAEAMARVAMQREQAVMAAGGDTMIALRKQLAELTITQAERDARLNFVAVERERLSQGLRNVDQLQAIQAQERYLQSKVEDLKSALGE